jgi:hypothetical protein
VTSFVNNWNVWKHGFHTWHATFSWDCDPDLLLTWQDSILMLGEQHQVYRIDHDELLGYRRARDGGLLPFLSAHRSRIEPIGDLPAGMVLIETEKLTSTLLSFADADGGIATEWVDDLNTLTTRLEIATDQGRAPLELYVTGGEHVFDEKYMMSFTITTCTDIWFPWNSRGRRADPVQYQPIDNRELSHLNGRRMNAFLKDVHAATQAVGGTFDPPRWGDPEHPQVDDGGIIVHAPRPPFINP